MTQSLRVVQYKYLDTSRPIWLKDGRNAQTLRLKELWPLLQHIPGARQSMGKAELLDLYESLLLEKAKALAGASWREPPAEGLMKRAAAEIGGPA